MTDQTIPDASLPQVNHNAATAGQTTQAVHTPRNLSFEAQHVIDALESHLVAVMTAARSASPEAANAVVTFGDNVLDKLEAWGVEFRGGLDRFRTPAASAPAAGSTASEASAGSGVDAGAAGSVPAAVSGEATA